MPSLVLNDWTEAKIMPMHRLGLGWIAEDATPFSLIIENLEADSSWSLAPLTRATDTGGTRVGAWSLEITAIVPYNRYQTLRPWLEALAFVMDTDTDIAISLRLQPQETQPGGAQMGVAMQATTDAAVAADLEIPFVQVKNWSIAWRIESAEWRPRAAITIRGIFSRDAITFGDASDPNAHGFGFFTQNESWP